MIPYSAFCTPASSQVSLDVHEEAVLPTLLRDRAGLDHTHIDVIENKLPSILYSVPLRCGSSKQRLIFSAPA